MPSDRVHQLLDLWFGNLGSADMPTSGRTNLWFGDNDVVKKQLVDLFSKEYNDLISGNLNGWLETPRGRLAMIILLDQYSRYVHHSSDKAFAQDAFAQRICIEGIQLKMDQSLTLIERVFFYMPLVHSENPQIQESSIRLYQDLASLSMTETSQIYQLFLAYAYAHFRVIKEFGRFPQRNAVLNRESTAAELAFLKNT
jgi:uncharacterized protein (DUF924 family)